MNFFNNVLTTFLGLGTFQLRCFLWRVRKLGFQQKKDEKGVLKMNEGLKGLEQHEDE